MIKNLSLLLSGGMLLMLSACGEGDIEGNCQPSLGDDPDCLIDGACEAECILAGTCTTAEIEPVGLDDGELIDRDDPDCRPCLLDDSCPPCDYDESLWSDADREECPCEGPNPPLRCNPFVPATVSMTAQFAYDNAADAGRSFVVETTMGDTELAPLFTVEVSDERVETTNNPAYVCALIVEGNGNLPGVAYSREIDTQAGLNDRSTDTREYVGYGVQFEAGNFTVSDNPQDTQAGRITGCSEKYVDPAVWGNESTGIADSLSAATWQFQWTNIAPVIVDLIRQDNQDNPDSDYDFYDLYGSDEVDAGRFIVGGGMSKPGASTDAATAYYISYAFDVDENFKPLENPEDEDAPGVFVPPDEMIPADAETKPASGLYFVRSFNRWGAQYILLDITPSG